MRIEVIGAGGGLGEAAAIGLGLGILDLANSFVQDALKPRANSMLA
jgi:hypothetical protein